MAFFFLKILVNLKYRPLNLVSYNFGSLTLHSATYSSLINFNHERRVRFSILTSQCHEQLYTESFCFSTPKATACVRHLTVPSWCPSVPVFGLSSPWSTLPGTEQSLQPVFPPCAMGGQAGAEAGWALRESRQEKHSLALPHPWHPVAVWDLQQSTRLHSPHAGLRQRSLCLHSKSWLFIVRQSIFSQWLSVET